MSGNYTNVKSLDRKRVLQSLTENLTQLNISIAFDGMQRHGDNLVCGSKPSDGTLHEVFGITIDMGCLDGPPVQSIAQLDDTVRKILFQKKNLVLSMETYKAYMVGALTNVSNKATAKMRLIVTAPEESLKIYPGTPTDPSPEKRMIYIFFGKVTDGLADMGNKLGGSKLQNDAKINTACLSLQSQNSLVFADSKSDLNDFLTHFSYANVDCMKCLLRHATDTVIAEGTLDNCPVGMFT
jgi:hypothetical protein